MGTWEISSVETRTPRFNLKLNLNLESSEGIEERMVTLFTKGEKHSSLTLETVLLFFLPPSLTLSVWVSPYP